MQFCLLDSPQKCYNCINRTSIFFQHPKEVFVCCLIVSLRCVFWVAPSIRGGGGINLPRPASQRAAAFILTAAMLTTLAAPAFAGTWYIEDGNITISAGTEAGTNKVEQAGKDTVDNDKDTIITNQNKDTASSNTVTIDAGNDKVEVTLKDVNIDTSSRNKAAVSVTGEGDTNIKLNGDNALKSDIYGSGSGSLTISGGENDSLTAQGGSGANGISSSGSVTISGGSTVTANGGSGTISGGDGICSSGGVTISGGSTVTANGGNGGSLVGGDGIRSGGGLTVSDGTVTAKGGNGDSKDGYGGDGIRSGGVVTISGNTVNAAGGYGGKVGGYGICSFDRVAISGGTVEAAGGNGSTGGGSGIYSSDIDLSGSLELTAKAGSPNGKALSQRGNELDLNTIKDKLGPGAKVTVTDANGKVNQVSIPRPVEPEEPSSSSDGGSAAPSAPAFSLPGLTVTDKDGQRISYTSTQSGNTLTVCVGRFTASFRISLAALRQLRAEGEGIETITFQTILCSTTLSVDELLAMGGEGAEAVLTHRFTDSSLTVG